MRNGELMFQKEQDRIFMNDDQGNLIAEGTFPETEPGVFTINHTFVDPSLRGQGVPSIVDVYGRDAYEFRENSIVVNILYDRLETAWTTSRKSTIENEKPDSGNEKLAIGDGKTDFGHQKVAIEKIYELCKEQNYNRPTMDLVLKVYENTGVDEVVSAPDVQRITQCSISTSKNIIWRIKM